MLQVLQLFSIAVVWTIIMEERRAFRCIDQNDETRSSIKKTTDNDFER